MPLAKSWSPWTVSELKLLSALPATVLTVPEPSVEVRTPPLPPVAQTCLPSVTAERMICGALAPVSTVLVS